MPGDPQLAEQAHKARIGAIVVDDKSGIDGPGALRRGDIHGGGVAARRGARFEQRYLMVSGQSPGAGQPGDAAADDGDVHERTILRNSRRWIPDGRLASSRRAAEAGGEGDVVFALRQTVADRRHRPIYAHPTGHGEVVFARQRGVDEARRDHRDGDPFRLPVQTQAVSKPAQRRLEAP